MKEIITDMAQETDLDLLFNGNTVSKVMQFYDYFSEAEELMKWVRSRPVGKAEIYEVEGENEIVVVIPTKNRFNSDSVNCAQNVFKGLKVIFVESGSDWHSFNYARNCNLGLKHALKYQPTWIILSNDDMIGIDNISKLRNGLRKIDSSLVKTVFTTPPGNYHSYLGGIGLTTKKREVIMYSSGKLKRMQLSLEKKFGINVVPAYPNWPLQYLTSQNRFFKITSSFGIFSGNYLRRIGGRLFDQMFLNMWEDTDISLEFSKDPNSYSYVSYSIGDKIGTSFGNTPERLLRSMVSRIYFNLKHKKEFTEKL